MAVKKTAAERAADLRVERTAAGEDVSHLSDIELLNEYLEMSESERINIRDRYMGLLVDQRKHGERVYANAGAEARRKTGRYADFALSQQANQLFKILSAVEALPERASAERVELLKRIAADTRFNIKNTDLLDPARLYQNPDAMETLRSIRAVVGVLGERDGLDVDEVIRLVKTALNGGHLLDLFEVADTGTLKSHLVRQQPQFVGTDWTERGDYYAYEPDGSGSRVVAYALGEDWYLDLYSPTGSLLAYGIAPEAKVAGIAVALVERAPAWAADRSRRPWQRYGELATAAAEKQLAHPH